MTEDLVRVVYQTTRDRKAWMKRQDRSIREINERGIDLQMDDQERELKNEIEEREERVEGLLEKMSEIQEELEAEKEEISTLKDQKEEIEEQKQDYTEWLDDLLTDREKGNPPFLFPDVIRNMDGFNDYQKSAEKVHQDLKDRAIEQKLNLRESDFTIGSGSGVGDQYLYEQADVDGEDSEADDQNEAGYSLNYDSGTADD